ncbi:MAG: glycosyltransferase [Thermoguttaceae bacterium]|jgi:tetratricopeptide (TPR) repeat protein
MKILAESLLRPRLSVAMIVRDEQEVLAESIESVGNIADEIVVLDTGSTDRTPELAAELGATVHHTPWENDFSSARNHCLRFVTGSWVLWLDAGERIRPQDATELRRFLDEQANSVVAYSVWVETPPREESASAEQCLQVKLLPTRADLRFFGRVRETLSDSLQLAGLQIAEAPCRIVRHPRQHEPQRLMAKARRDLALASAEAEVVGEWSPRLFLVSGQAHGILGDQDQAREMLRRAAEISPPGSAQRLEAFYGLLTTFDEDPDLHASQLTACLDSLEDFPFDLQLLLALGNYMLVRERLDLAIRAFEAAVRYGRITPAVWHLCEVREIAAVCLGLALQARQRDDEACSVLETALAARPESLRLLRQLQNVYRKLGKSAEALALAKRLPSSLLAIDPDPRSAREDRQQLRFDAGRRIAGVLVPHIAALKGQAVSE